MDMVEDAASPEEILSQFNRLIRELMRGQINRNTFRPWEVRLLLDFEACQLRESAREKTLRRYQKAVQRQMEQGATAPMLLSEFLGTKA
jgi:hypothetical protein